MTAGSIALVAVGAVSPMGLDARQTALQVRAGKLEPRPTPWIAASGRRLACARSRALPDAITGDARRSALAALALEECAVTLGEPAARSTPLFLAWPSSREQDLETGGRSGPLEHLLEGSPIAIDPRRSSVVRGGRAAFAEALRQGLSCLASGERELVLVAAADTHLDRPRLEELDAELRLVSEAVGDGILPSEGAVFLALGAGGRGAPLCHLRTLAVGRDEAPRADDVGVATGLVDVMRRASAAAGVPTWWITDVRTERSSRKEHDFARLRCRAEIGGAATTELVEELGDTGVALSAHQIAFAAMGFRLGFARGARALCTSTGDDGITAALVLEAIA